MNQTTELHFREWQKPAQTLQIVSWRSREGLLFAREPNGGPKVLRLDLPAFHQHVGQESSSLSKETGQPRLAWPDAVPVTIAEVRLMPPPCRGNISEAESLRQQASSGAGTYPHYSQTKGWELARLRYDAEVLVPTPADKDEFATSLKRFLVDRQNEYDQRKAELATLKALVDRRRGIIGHARYYSGLRSWPESSLEWKLQQERLSLDLDFPQGCLQWTAADAHHRPSIRNPILRARWFQTFGLTPDDMMAQRRRFLDTLPPDKPGKDFSARWGPRPDFFARMLKDPICYRPLNDLEEPLEVFGDVTRDHLTCCAQVRFLVTFEDQTHIWLTDCLRRAPQNQGERLEFDSDPERNSKDLDTMKTGQALVLATVQSVDRKSDQVLSSVQKLTGLAGEQALTRDKPYRGAQLEKDFSLAVIPQGKGEPLRLAIEPELQSLLKRIVEAGGSLPRTTLRKSKTDTYQPEKLLCSETAKALMKAGLLGRQLTGRTSVFWAKVRVE